MTSIEEKESELISRANKLATLSVQKGCGPFGCVITDLHYKKVAEGNNQVTEWNDPTAHAEIVAIRNACKELETFDLSSCRLFSSCEPCPMCLSAIYWSRIKHVCYGNTRHDAKDIGFDDAFIYDELAKDVEDRTVLLKRVRSDNELDSFKLWAESDKKIEY
jgi:tRNA(Arg) A34 adenosine deaminase TadA